MTKGSRIKEQRDGTNICGGFRWSLRRSEGCLPSRFAASLRLKESQGKETAAVKKKKRGMTRKELRAPRERPSDFIASKERDTRACAPRATAIFPRLLSSKGGTERVSASERHARMPANKELLHWRKSRPIKDGPFSVGAKWLHRAQRRASLRVCSHPLPFYATPWPELGFKQTKEFDQTNNSI